MHTKNSKMVPRKGSATASFSTVKTSSWNKRAKVVRAESPPVSKGLEFEIDHAPWTPWATPRSRRTKQEAISQAKAERALYETERISIQMHPPKKKRAYLRSSPFLKIWIRNAWGMSSCEFCISEDSWEIIRTKWLNWHRSRQIAVKYLLN